MRVRCYGCGSHRNVRFANRDAILSGRVNLTTSLGRVRPGCQRVRVERGRRVASALVLYPTR